MINPQSISFFYKCLLISKNEQKSFKRVYPKMKNIFPQRLGNSKEFTKKIIINKDYLTKKEVNNKLKK